MIHGCSSADKAHEGLHAKRQRLMHQALTLVALFLFFPARFTSLIAASPVSLDPVLFMADYLASVMAGQHVVGRHYAFVAGACPFLTPSKASCDSMQPACMLLLNTHALLY